MRTTLFILIFFLLGLSACQNQQVDSGNKEKENKTIDSSILSNQVDSIHQEKVKKIIERVVSGKPLAEKFNAIPSISFQAAPPYPSNLYYWVKRMLNGEELDSVLMEAYINDSLPGIDFTENYSLHHHNLPYYRYVMQKDEITFACLYVATPEPNHPGRVYYQNNLERSHPDAKNDTTPTIDKEYTLELKDKADLERHLARERKSIPFFLPKLYYSIDELYDLLFQEKKK